MHVRCYFLRLSEQCSRATISRQLLGLSAFACVWPRVLTSNFGFLHRLETRLRIVIIAADFCSTIAVQQDFALRGKVLKNLLFVRRGGTFRVQYISAPSAQPSNKWREALCVPAKAYLPTLQVKIKGNWTIALLHVDSCCSTIVSPLLVSKSKVNKGKDEVTVTSVYLCTNSCISDYFSSVVFCKRIHSTLKCETYIYLDLLFDTIILQSKVEWLEWHCYNALQCNEKQC